MNKPLAALLCAALLCAPITALAHTATADDAGESRYKALRLTPDVYRNASAELSDLRLYDAAGEAVPYFIRSGVSEQQAEARRSPLTQTDAFLKDDAFFFDFAAPSTPGTDVVATALAFTTQSSSFAKEVTVLGSHDGTHWDEICTDTLYRVDNVEKLELALPGPQKYTHYRLRLSNNLEQLTFDGAELVYSAQSEASYPLVEQLRPAYTVEQSERETVVTVSGLKHLKLSQIVLEADGMFQRIVSTEQHVEQLYQLMFSDVAYRDTALALDGRPWPDDTLVITVENGDDKPIALTGVTVEYHADELIFEGGRGPYRLEFGAALDAPDYDIATYRTQVLTQPIDRLSIAQVTLDAPAPEPASGIDGQLVLNLVVVAVAVLLGVVILTRIRKT